MRRAARARRNGLRSPGLLLAALSLCATPGVRAQSLEEQVIQRRLEFEQAGLELDAARAAYGVVDRQFSAALAAVREARTSGDEAALEQAFAVAQARSLPLGAQESRVADARRRLEETRQALVDALTRRLQQLVIQLEAAPAGERQVEIDAIYRDRRAELTRLEAEAQQEVFRINLALLPDVTFDPRDGPDDLETKAQLVERYAAMVDTVVQDIDRQLEALRERRRNEQQRDDLLASVGRFDDTSLPVGVTTGPPAADVAADSTGVGNRPLTLEERIEQLVDLRGQMVLYRDQVLVKAQTFRRRIGSIV